jgi:hypothetical protein
MPSLASFASLARENPSKFGLIGLIDHDQTTPNSNEDSGAMGSQCGSGVPAADPQALTQDENTKFTLITLIRFDRPFSIPLRYENKRRNQKPPSESSFPFDGLRALSKRGASKRDIRVSSFPPAAAPSPRRLRHRLFPDSLPAPLSLP